MDRVETLVSRNERHWTVAEYQRLAELGVFEGERVELIRGRVVKMAAMGVGHASAVQRINKLLVLTFGELADVRPQLPMKVSNESMPEPDFLLVEPHSPDAIEQLGHAHLALELADTSLRYDREVKARLYAQARVPEYWLLELRAARVEVFTQPRSGRYAKKRTFKRGDVLRPTRFPSVAIEVAALFGSRA